jgi:hypothetical protein
MFSLRRECTKVYMIQLSVKTKIQFGTCGNPEEGEESHPKRPEVRMLPQALAWILLVAF